MTHEEKEARSVVVREVLQERYLNLLKRQYGYSNMKPDAEVAELVCYPSYEHFTAAFIQSFFRHRKEGHAKAFARMREFKRYSLYHVAAFEIQSAWRVTCQRWELKLLTGELMRKHGINHVSTSRIWAASKIQNAWRKNSNYRIYSALLDLVARFRGMGDPHLLLKAVLPRESMLLDPSMQVHVRFRLGGERFPPSIYYKIFTHGAVCDLGAFAPRNYAAERLGAPRREEDFYCRSENNGWRPLVVRYQVGARGPRRDPIEKATAQKIVKIFIIRDCTEGRMSSASEKKRHAFGCKSCTHCVEKRMTMMSQNALQLVRRAPLEVRCVLQEELPSRLRRKGSRQKFHSSLLGHLQDDHSRPLEHST
jgi:hypothetical protein